MAQKDFEQLYQELEEHFKVIYQSQAALRKKLERHSDSKTLKGDEIVGWLGEIYGKLFLDGTLVSDEFEYDFIAKNKRVSVKARKGYKSNWKRTSSIPKIEGTGCPTHLMFIHLNDDYSVDKIWLYPWKYLFYSGRFMTHFVRGNFRSYYFTVKPEIDTKYIVYDGKRRG